MANDLTKISGIGAAAAASLSEAGFTNIDNIANATPEELSKAKGFGPERAARVIAAAKELSETAEPASVVAPSKAEEMDADAQPEEKPEPKIDPVIAAETSGHIASGGKPKGLILTAAAVAVVGILIAFPQILTGIHDTLRSFGPPMPAKPQAVKVVENQFPAVQHGKEAGNPFAPTQPQATPEWVTKQREQAEKFRAEAQKRFDANQQPQATPEWVAKQREQAEKFRAEAQKRFAANQQPQATPEWVAKQREQAEKFRAEAQKRFAANQQPQATPEWVTKQREQAEKFRAEAQKRFASQQPQATPEWVTKQREQAEKFRAEAQKRFAANQRHYAAYNAAQAPVYGVPYGMPPRNAYYGPYGPGYGFPQGYYGQQRPNNKPD